MRTMFNLPPELRDHVLDCLRGNRRALFRCALVCKPWYHRAQRNLFHTIHFDWCHRARTLSLLEALQGSHALVHELTISFSHTMEPDEYVTLVETLENLEVLSFYAPTAMSELSLSIDALFGNATDERLLSAIANKAKLRILNFTLYDGDLCAWVPSAEAQPAGAVLGQSLRQLHALDGDLFPAPRMHRLWAAVTAAKAQAGAVPLTRFGTSVARNGVLPLARLLDASGAQLLTLRLDFRADPSWRVQDTADAVSPSSALSLFPCARLRNLKVHLSGPSADSHAGLPVFAALLLTVPPSLSYLRITIDSLAADAFTVPGFRHAMAVLDARMARLPQLRRVDVRLVPGERRTLPRAAAYRLADALGRCLARCVRREGLRVTWRVLR
ncbi:F-box protein [Phanerochaete sordida]|uniref:F-box protein n=1 Tax=Phanerochaete sordida TaxID=48140 RepID=A0A9P3LIW3_9APHY|nr:F-box protein [Phanerochaete sordida]